MGLVGMVASSVSNQIPMPIYNFLAQAYIQPHTLMHTKPVLKYMQINRPGD